MSSFERTQLAFDLLIVLMLVWLIIRDNFWE